MVFQSIFFISCKKYKALLLLLLHIPLACHLLLPFSNLYIGYLLKYRFNFKLCCITHHAISLGELHYLNSLLIPGLNPHSLCSSSFNPLMLPFFNKMSNGFRTLLLMLHHSFGTIYQTLLVLHQRTYLLEKTSKHIF